MAGTSARATFYVQPQDGGDSGHSYGEIVVFFEGLAGAGAELADFGAIFREPLKERD